MTFALTRGSMLAAAFAATVLLWSLIIMPTGWSRRSGVLPIAALVMAAALSLAAWARHSLPASDGDRAKRQHCAAARARVAGVLYSLRPETVDVGRAAALELSAWMAYCDGEGVQRTFIDALVARDHGKVRSELERFGGWIP